jgi:hypothetical protein
MMIDVGVRVTYLTEFVENTYNIYILNKFIKN